MQLTGQKKVVISSNFIRAISISSPGLLNNTELIEYAVVNVIQALGLWCHCKGLKTAKPAKKTYWFHPTLNSRRKESKYPTG